MKNRLNETTTHPGNFKVFFKGDISEKRTFIHDVIVWYQAQDTQKMFKDCEHKPMDTDRDAILAENSWAIPGRERMQAGAEITLSARFSQNVLLPVLHCGQTMMPSLGTRTEIIFASQGTHLEMDDNFKWTFGDSFIIQKDDRVEGFQPDIVMKADFQDKGQEIRMVGELKSCATVPLNDMYKLARINKPRKLFGILGTYSNCRCGIDMANYPRANRSIHAGTQDQVRLPIKLQLHSVFRNIGELTKAIVFRSLSTQSKCQYIRR